MGTAAVFADPGNNNSRRFYIQRLDGTKEYINSKYMVPPLGQWGVPINEGDILASGDTVESYIAELKASWKKEQEQLKNKEALNQDSSQATGNNPEPDKENKSGQQNQATGSPSENKSDSSGSPSKDKKARLDKPKKENDKQKVINQEQKKEQPTQANQVSKQQQETPLISSAAHSFHLMQHAAFTANNNISKHFDSRFERGINTGSSFTRNNFWGTINYLTGKNKTDLTGEYDLNSTGVTIGYDIAPDELLDYAFGIALTYAGGKADPNHQQIKLEQDLYLGSLYSNFLFKQFDMLAAVHFGSGSNEQKIDDAKNNYDSNLWGLSLQGGYVISTRQVSIKPLMEFNYLSASFDDVSVSDPGGSGANAKIHNSDITVSEIGAGVQLYKTCDIRKRGELRLNGQLMAYHDFNDDKHDTRLSLLPSSGSGVTTTFRDQIKTQERYKAGAGVGFQTAKNLTVDLNYDYFWNDKSDVSAVSLQFGFLF